MQNDGAYYTNNKQKRYGLNKWISILLVEADGLVGINYKTSDDYIFSSFILTEKFRNYKTKLKDLKWAERP